MSHRQYAVRPRGAGDSRRHRKQMLAVSAMAGQIAWLDGLLRWQAGRIVWVDQGRAWAPAAGDLALAQRRLYQIDGYRQAAERALGDFGWWRKEKQSRFELAKWLQRLQAPHLPILAERVRGGDDAATGQVAELLAAEALCVNALPASPGATLLACRERARPALLTLLGDWEAPAAGRALAALVLGSIERRLGRPDAGRPAELSSWEARAFDWGVRWGFPEEPALLVSLLAEPAGEPLAHRYETTCLDCSSFALPAELLRELQSRLPAETIVELAEAAVAVQPAVERLTRRPEYGHRTWLGLRGQNEWSYSDRRRVREQLAELVRDYARSTGDPSVIRTIGLLCTTMARLGEPCSDLAAAVLKLLHRGLSLPAELQRVFLELLVQEHDRLWDPVTRSGSCGQNAFGLWLQARHDGQVGPLLRLLEASGDPALVRRALALNELSCLAAQSWRDPGLCELAVELLEELGTDDDHFAHSLLAALPHFRTAESAATVLRRLVRPIPAEPPFLRRHLLDQMLSAVPRTRRGMLEVLPILTRYARRIGEFAADDERVDCRCDLLPRIALALERTVPSRAEAWFDWLIGHLLQASPNEHPARTGECVEDAVTVGLALADGDLATFQAVVLATDEHRLHQEREELRRGLRMLRQVPSLRTPLAVAFHRQPRRCSVLLARLGQTEHLGEADCAALARLESALSPAADDELPADWAAIVEAAPSLRNGALAYLRAQALLQRSAEAPVGVRQALEQPARLARELAYLERLTADQPHRGDLVSRVESLRRRLSDPAHVERAACAEAAERLAVAVVGGQLAAADQQVLACFRGRLAALAGVPAFERPIDDDLINAVLLSINLDQNRRLLRRLLRAELAGDREWLLRQPPNARFLDRLAARGTEPQRWLGSHPMTYRCVGAAGGRVRLHLETSPLRILQMGNFSNTCLSTGSFNAYSTVTNACDLNKRVIYAVDGDGRVVGRKLFAINADWRLVGFRTYAALVDRPANAGLRAIFRHYCGAFAADCGLELADDGAVSSLVTPHWWNDGTAPWGDCDPANEPDSAFSPGGALACSPAAASTRRPASSGSDGLCYHPAISASRARS